MSTAGLSARSYSALGNDGVSVAMRWLEMLLPESSQVQAGTAAYSLRVIEDPTNKVVRMVTDPLNLISIMGPARSGKSTLMNLLAGCKVTELFPTYPGMETFTKGIYIPTRMLSLSDFSALEGATPVQSSTPNMKVTFVDTEGQGAIGTSYDMSLFSPALISSRVVIYNRTGGLLVEEIINQLGMMTQAAQRLRSGDGPSVGPIFGHLFIIFNQFRLNKTDTTATLQATLINDENQTDNSSKNRNAIRALLRSAFESIQVFILPDQLKEDARDALADGSKQFLLLEDFRPKYLDYFKILRASLSQALIQPRELTKGIALTGGALADFMPQFAAAINKAEPLNVPSIFEAAQNGAINKALNTFSVSLTTTLDGRLADPPRATVMLGNLIESDITLLLAQLAYNISYMPQTTVQKAQDDARASTLSPKTSALAVNLTRLRGIMSTRLNEIVNGMSQMIDVMFQDDTLLVSQSEAETQIAGMETSKATDYQTTGNFYDVQSFPEGWRQSLSNAIAPLKPNLWIRMAARWNEWATNFKNGEIKGITESLVSLGQQKSAGEGSSYAGESSIRVQAAKESFNAFFDSHYKWNDKADQKAQFASTVDNIAQTRKAIWEQNDTATRTQLATLLQRLQLLYDVKLQDSLTPQVEPMPYATIVDDSELQAQLTTFLTNNKVSTSLTNETRLQFQGAVSLKKSNYNSTYTRVTNEYREYLTGEFTRRVPVCLTQYRNDVDAIELNLASSANTKVNVSSQCDALQTQARAKYNLLLATLGVKTGGSISTSIVQTYSISLEDSLKQIKREKLDKYDEVVGMYNKSLLAGATTPVVDKALANKFANDEALNGDVDDAKTKYMYKARGDGVDRDQKWSNWYSTIYPLLLETVRRYNAYNTPGLDGNKAATKEIQIAVIKRIYERCADMANILGMSWISWRDFDVETIEDMGLSQPDPLKPGSQSSRTLRLNNTYQPQPGDYEGARKTNLCFLDWSVEISDIVWGSPIITEIKPSRIDTFEYPAQATPYTVTVGTNTTEISTISDSFTWGVGGGLEAGYKWGVKDQWEANVKATFNANMSSTNTKTATTQFSTSISTQLVMPANRTNVVNQMVFDQRTSLPYTAKVRVVPKLRFQNGFTKWGGGGSYRTNPNTSALKDSFKHGDERTYGPQDLGRCDEIRSNARADADPWYWKLAMERNPYLTTILDGLADPSMYEVYVKGKWEGITGKYSVTTVTPKTTTLSLMPNV